MSSSKKPTVALYISLVAGILILINSSLLGVASYSLTQSIPGKGGAGIMGFLISILFGALVNIFNTVTGFLNTLMAIGVISGLIVIASAVMFYRNPVQKTMWGILILLFSSISMIVGGGFLIGLILGINGGILAIIWEPKSR